MRERGRKTKAAAKERYRKRLSTKLVLPLKGELQKLHCATSSLVCRLRPIQRIEPNEKKSEILFPAPSLCGAFKEGCFCIAGGDEPGEAQLGAPQRGPPRPDHGGGYAQPGQDQTPAGHQRGQETSGARCESETPRCQILRTGLMESLCVT